MSLNIDKFVKSALNLPRYIKRIIVIFADLNLCILCTWFAFNLRLEEFNFFTFVPLNASLISLLLFLPVFWILGVYRVIFRYSGVSIIFLMSKAVIIYGFLYFLIIGFYRIELIGIYGIENVPRSIGIIQPMLLLFTTISLRFFIKFLLNDFITFDNNSIGKKNILIYGAGVAGQQLVDSLENNSNSMNVVGFLDDDKKLHNQILSGKTIFSPLKLDSLIRSRDISLILLALQSINRNKKNKIIQSLGKFKLIVKTLPSIQDIVDERVSISDIRDLNIEDLLRREEVEPYPKLLNKNINSKIVMVTGAGGSIGSELCKQIIKLSPTKLIIIENSEYALHEIYQELLDAKENLANNPDIKIIPLITSVQDEQNIKKIIKIYKPHTLYHAAAYKHVSFVEENICEGLKNNIFGTLFTAKAALDEGVSDFVLISSDKAVRPTNIMGASKRIAEICLQALSDNSKNFKTKFCMVRFGNVFDSSGSVVGKFKKQIKKGGPLTLSHPQVTRYFMTVTEASQLVIQASAMAKGSDVFVLDMGEPIKISDLARNMITLSGFSIQDNDNPDGDIKINIVGLKSGEKLYEELLIKNNPIKTDHPKIFRAEEPSISLAELNKELLKLKKLIDQRNINDILIIIEKLVLDFKANRQIKDKLFIEESNSNNNK